MPGKVKDCRKRASPVGRNGLFPNPTQSAIRSLALEADGRRLAVVWTDGGTSRFQALWLRDNLDDAASRDPSSGQRLHTVTDLPLDTRLTRAVLAGDGAIELAFLPDGHAARLTPDWLRAHDPGAKAGTPDARLPEDIELWDAGLAADLPAADWAAVTTDETALAAWLGQVARLGFAVLRQAPREPGTVLRAVELFGHVRETNYGRLFDVRSEVNPINLAYTGLGLQVHTDNPYRDPVPTLQLLHCLTDAADGGDSVVVDGFAAALRLEAEAPDHFATLTREIVRFAYRNPDTALTARAPMIGLDGEGRLREIRFNNRSLAPFMGDPERVERLYAAYAAFARMLERPALQVVFKLAPGDLFIVDNRRVLHGRTGFAGTGHRHLQGCYADMDGLLSRLTILRDRLGKEAYR